MAYKNENLAYDLSLFEASSAAAEKKEAPKKKDNLIELDIKAQESTAKKKKPLAMTGYILSGLIVVAVVIALLCGQAQLTELNQKVSESKTMLEEQQSIYIQTQMRLEASLSPEMIHEYASNVLGMVKTDNSKKEFIKLAQGDEVVIASEQEKSAVSYLTDKITALWE